MAERQSIGVPLVRANTVEGMRQELNFALQHLANQLDQLQGNRGTPQFRSDVNLNGKRLTNVGTPSSDTDAVPAGLALTRATTTAPYNAGGTTIINVEGGATTTDAVNVSQLRDALAAGDLSGETFVVISLSGKLSAERQLAIEASVLSLLDNGAGATVVLGVAANGITDTKLRDSAAVSVIGRSANSSGDPADIAASADGQVLRRASNVVGFGAVDLADTDAVTGVLPSANLPSATWTDQTASRALNTTYTQGSATRSMLVLATVRCQCTLAGGTAYVQAKQDTSTPPTTVASGSVGISGGLLGEDNSFMVAFLVPAGTGQKYRIDSTTVNGTTTLGIWIEVTL